MSPALAGLARCYVATGALDQAKQDAGADAGSQAERSPRSPPRAPRWNSPSRRKSLGPIGELEQKVAANPLDHQARFDLAVALNAAGKREEAPTICSTIVKRDRKWNDDGARKQLVQFFEAWGPTDRRRSKDASGCRRSCFRKRHRPRRRTPVD